MNVLNTEHKTQIHTVRHGNSIIQDLWIKTVALMCCSVEMKMEGKKMKLKLKLPLKSTCTLILNEWLRVECFMPFNAHSYDKKLHISIDCTVFPLFPRLDVFFLLSNAS